MAGRRLLHLHDRPGRITGRKDRPAHRPRPVGTISETTLLTLSAGRGGSFENGGGRISGNRDFCVSLSTRKTNLWSQTSSTNCRRSRTATVSILPSATKPNPRSCRANSRFTQTVPFSGFPAATKRLRTYYGFVPKVLRHPSVRRSTISFQTAKYLSLL